MQFAPPDNPLFDKLIESGDEKLIALARKYADAAYQWPGRSWREAVNLGMVALLADTEAREILRTAGFVV